MNEANQAPTIGTPILHRDRCNNRTGYIYQISENDNVFSLSGGGLKSCGARLDVVWLDDEHRGCRRDTVHAATVAHHLEEAQQCNIEPCSPEDLERYLGEADAQTRQANETATSKREAREKSRADYNEHYRDRVPVWAKGVIVATLMKDESDVQTDYFHASTVKNVILGFSKHKRDLFPEMKKHAAKFEETAILGQKDVFRVEPVASVAFDCGGRQNYKGERSHWHKEAQTDEYFFSMDEAQAYAAAHPLEPINFQSAGLVAFEWDIRPVSFEHREKYSMGSGYYLKEKGHHRDGWLVQKISNHNDKPLSIEDMPQGEWIADRDPTPPPSDPTPTKSTKGAGFEVMAGTRAGFTQIKFDGKPSDTIRTELKSAGYRWSRHNGVWYGKSAALPSRYLTGEAVESPAAEPIQTASKAAALRAKAEAMQPAINQKLNPACSHQNPTARRARMADSMRLDGERLQASQGVLLGLAALHESGEVPDAVRGIDTRQQIDALLKVSRLGDKYMNEDDAKRLSRAGLDTPAQIAEAVEIVATLESNQPKPDPVKQSIKDKERALIGRKIDGFFPTPQSVIDTMLSYFPDDFDEREVLEPSAGVGTIAERIRERGGRVYCLEVNGSLREILELKGFHLAGSDFKDYGGTTFKYILMNPPFERGQDISHIMQAYNLLQPDGVMAAICGEGAFFKSDAKSKDFQDFIELCAHEVIELGDAFNEKGEGRIRTTGARSRLVIFKK